MWYSLLYLRGTSEADRTSAGAMAEVIVNEVLCYLQNNYGNHPKNAIRTTMSGFYDDDEIASAKLTLFKFADSL